MIPLSLFLLGGVLLCLAGLIVRVVVLSSMPEPAQIEATYDGATVSLRADNRRIPFSTDCLTVRWQTDSIQAVYFNEQPTVGMGEAETCGTSPALTVVFRDNFTQVYTLERRVIVDHPLNALLLALAAGLGLAALWFAPLARPFHRWLARVLPPLHRASPSELRLHLWLVCGLILVGVALRLAYIDQPVRGDEAWTFRDFAFQPLTVGLVRYDTTNNHLLHTLLVHLSYVTFGNQLALLRLPAFIAGVLLIPAVYRAGRDLYNGGTGLLAAALVAVSSHLIEFSTSARGYTLMALFFVLQIIVAGRLLRGGGGWRLWTALSACFVLGLYTLPASAYGSSVVGVWLLVGLLRGGDRRRLVVFIISMGSAAVITGLLHLPPLLYLRSLEAGSGDFGHLGSLPLEAFAETLPPDLGNIVMLWTRDLPLIGVLLLLAGLVIALFAHRQLNARQPVALALVLLVWTPLLMLVPRLRLLERTWVSLLPLVLIIAAAGLVYLIERSRWRRLLSGGAALAAVIIGGGAVLASGSVLVSGLSSVMPDADAVIAYLDEQVQPGDVVVGDNGTINILGYYATRDGLDLGTLSETYQPAFASQRLFVVSRHSLGRTLERIGGIDTRLHHPPESLRRFVITEVLLAAPVE